MNNNLPDNPEIEVIKAGKTGLFTNYIFKAIPLAFDESMSYYETLCGLLNYLQNTIIPTVNNNADAVAELQSLYEQLKTYVDDYFTNLDVQQEINNKLDAMAEDGSLTLLIKRYVDPLIDAQNERIGYYETITNNRLDSINMQINRLESGAPIPVDATENMTDTTKLYVLTTDGYVYYYNGSEWVQGWIYQSTGISENDPIIVNINNKINDCIKTYDNIFNKDTIVQNKSPKSTTIDDLADTQGVNCSGIIPCKGETTYTFSSHISGQNNVFFYLENGNYAFRLPIVEQEDGTWQVTTYGGNLTPSYMRFQYAPIYVDLDTFMIVEGTELPTEYQPYGKYINPSYLKKEWKQINENTNKISNIENIIYTQNNVIDIFNKGVCIGDSITSGTFNYTSPSSGYLENNNYSYPKYLHKLTNIDIDNYGRGGYTAPQYAQAYAQHDWSGYDFAIIMFGINDVLQNVSPTDSMAGITSIINSLKSYNNNIKIFLSTITPAYTDGNNLFDEENDAIRNLANSLQNVYLIDLNKISKCHKNTPYVQGHLTALGYNQTAREFMYAISDIISNNLTNFRNVQFIGTNYNYNI